MKLTLVEGMLVKGSYEGMWAAIHEFNERMEKKEQEERKAWLKQNVRLWSDHNE